MFDPALEDLGISFVKVLVMFTGEINFDEETYELGREKNNLMRVKNISIVFLVLFLVVVCLVLSNLLIAIAVNVTEEEKKLSKIIQIKKSLAHAEEIEHVLLSLNCFKNHFQLFSYLDDFGIGTDCSFSISFFPNRPKDQFWFLVIDLLSGKIPWSASSQGI